MPKILGNQVLQLQSKIPKGELLFPTRNSKTLLVSKVKNLIGFVLVEKLKTFMAATKCFHLATASPNKR